MAKRNNGVGEKWLNIRIFKIFLDEWATLGQKVIIQNIAVIPSDTSAKPALPLPFSPSDTAQAVRHIRRSVPPIYIGTPA